MTPELATRLLAYLDKHPAWGALHIVLDDGNIEDDHVEGCIEWAREQGDTEGEWLADQLRDELRSTRALIYEDVQHLRRYLEMRPVEGDRVTPEPVNFVNESTATVIVVPHHLDRVPLQWTFSFLPGRRYRIEFRDGGTPHVSDEGPV